MRRGRVSAVPLWPYLLAIAGLFALQVWCFRWGVITPDTVDQFAQIRSGQYEDWHPPVTTWIWKQLWRLGQGTAPILVTDCALYWLGFGLLADRFRRLGNPFAAALVIAIGALPIPFGQMGGILKDPLLTALLLSGTGLLALGRLGSGRVPVVARVVAIGLLLVAGAVRINSVPAVAPILLLALWAPRRLLAIAGALAGAALLLLGTSWAINHVALKPRATWPIISLVQFDLAGIAIRSDPSVYPADIRPERDVLVRCYRNDQYNAPNYEDCNDLGDAVVDEMQRQPNGVARVWLGAIVHHPLAYAEHRLAHWNWNQRWLVRTVPDDAVYIMNTPNDYGLTFHDTAASRFVAWSAQDVAESPLGRPATWTAVAIALLILAPHLVSRALVTALGGSALLYALFYLPMSVAPDLRYNLWTMLAAMIGLLIALVELPRTAAARRDLVLAAVPVAIVIAGELVAMAA